MKFNSNFAEFILENKYIKIGGTEQAFLQNLLPNMNLCNCYNNLS